MNRALAWLLACTLLLVALLAGAAAMHYPLAREARGDALQPLGLANLASGTALVKPTTGGGTGWLEWHWCPGLDPLRWCLDYASAHMTTSARLNMRRVAERVRLRVDSAALGAAVPATLRFTLRGELDRVALPGPGCALDLSGTRSAQLHLDAMSLAGQPVGAHRLVLEPVERAGEQRFRLEGETAQGVLSLRADGSWQLDLSFAGRVPGDARATTSMQLAGRLPCPDWAA